MPLADGTNDQREDLAVPLPAEWTRESLTDVVLYGTHASPPCCKVRALLKLAGVPFRRRFGRASGAYAKFPVLFVNGRQINDSYVIFKSLAPVLFGRPYSAEDVALGSHARPVRRCWRERSSSLPRTRVDGRTAVWPLKHT